MQGLPTQNFLSQMISKGSVKGANEQKGQLGEQVSLEGSLGSSEEAFASILGQLNSKKSENLENVISEKNINPELLNKISDGQFESLKNNSDSQVVNLILNSDGKPVAVNVSEIELPMEENINQSALDFLTKNAGKKSEVPTEPEANKKLNSLLMKNDKPEKSFFIKHDNLDENGLISKESKNPFVSSQDFVELNQAKNAKKTNVELLGKDNVNLETHMKNAQNKMIQGYHKDHSVLNNTLIKNTNDLAFKDKSKTKLDAIDELKSPELAKANELTLIKSSPFVVTEVAKENGANQESQSLKLNNQAQVLDLNKLNTTNSHEIIKKISDYVQQSQVAGRDHLDLTVKHDSLGQFQIQVNKVPNQNQVDMQIVTSSKEGHQFFLQNESAIARNLQQSGIQLSDLRIVSSMSEVTPFSQSESKQFSSFNHQQGQNSQSHSFSSFESSDFRGGSERRKELWNAYREKLGA